MSDPVAEAMARVGAFADIVEDCGTGAVLFDVDGANKADLITADLRLLLSALREAREDGTEAGLFARVVPDETWNGGGYIKCKDASIAIGSLLTYATLDAARTGDKG